MSHQITIDEWAGEEKEEMWWKERTVEETEERIKKVIYDCKGHRYDELDRKLHSLVREGFVESFNYEIGERGKVSINVTYLKSLDPNLVGRTWTLNPYYQTDELYMPTMDIR